MIIAENSAETNPVAIDVAIRQPFLYAILATAENHQQELAQCNDKKAKKAFIEGCGGANKVHPFQNFRTFWESLTIELRTKGMVRFSQANYRTSNQVVSTGA